MNVLASLAWQGLKLELHNFQWDCLDSSLFLEGFHQDRSLLLAPNASDCPRPRHHIHTARAKFVQHLGGLNPNMRARIHCVL